MTRLADLGPAARRTAEQILAERGGRPRVPTEHEEQADLIARCDAGQFRWPELALVFAVPNGGYRSRRTAGRMRAEGLKAGVPDLVLPVARGPWHGLFLELKRTKGGTVSPVQAAWHRALEREGYRVAVCRGADEAWAALMSYLGTQPEE